MLVHRKRHLVVSAKRHELLAVSRDWASELTDVEEAISVIDRAGNMIYHNEAFAEISGCRRTCAQRAIDLWDPDYRSAAVLLSMVKAMATRVQWSGQIYNRHRDGTLYLLAISVAPVFQENGAKPSNFMLRVAPVADHSDKAYLYDYPTCLPNWGLTNFLLDDAIGRLKAGSNLMLAQVHLQGLAAIGGAYGYGAVDAILIEAARRLYTAKRAPAQLARLAGGDFLVCYTGNAQDIAQSTLAKGILEALQKPYKISPEQVLPLLPRIGMSMASDGADTSDALSRNCSIAVERSKVSGQPVVYYSPSMFEEISTTSKIVHHLQGVLERKEMTLVYQPLVATKSGRLAGYEALLRWTSPVLGTVSPEKFIRAAEDHGLIIPLENWVLQTACAQAVKWLAYGRPFERLNVNISAIHVQSGSLVADVLAALASTGLPANRLSVEITEFAALGDSPEVLNVLEELAHFGVSLAVDDFGIGYSSISYLRQFPFQTLKIDRSFVLSMETDRKSRALVEGMIAMAKALNLKVVAEGVENVEQQTFLKEQGCDVVQGFYYGAPLPPADVEKALNDPMSVI